MWQEKNIEIDAVSEKYRKYIIGIYHEEKSWYVLWGADLSTKDETDKLWLNQHKEILLFDNIEAIRKVVLSHRYRLFDDNNLMQWAKDHASNQAYASYDLDRIKLVITIRNILKNIIPENCMEIVTFVNLFSNYAYQHRVSAPK